MEAKKYFEKVDRDNDSDNEFNRTQVDKHVLVTADGRHIVVDDDQRQNWKTRIFDKIDSQGKYESYINALKRANPRAIRKVQGGMSDTKDLCYLQVRGINQFEREL